MKKVCKDKLSKKKCEILKNKGKKCKAKKTKKKCKNTCGFCKDENCEDTKSGKWCDNKKDKCHKASVYKFCEKTCNKCNDKPKGCILPQINNPDNPDTCCDPHALGDGTQCGCVS